MDQKATQGTKATTTVDDRSPSSRETTHHLAHMPSIFRSGSATGDGKEHANKWAVLAISAAGGFMTTLDSSIVNIGLPAIAKTFGVGVSGAIEWIIIGYLIVIAAVLLSFGRLADMIGRKPIYELGLVIFVVGSILSGAAPSLGFLIAARIFQGLGGALIFSVNTVFPNWCSVYYQEYNNFS